jgi:hypothetical protein
MDSFGKARKLRRETKDWFARRNFFVRAVDIGVFAEIAPVSLRNDEVVAIEF